MSWFYIEMYTFFAYCPELLFSVNTIPWSLRGQGLQPFHPSLKFQSPIGRTCHQAPGQDLEVAF